MNTQMNQKTSVSRSGGTTNQRSHTNFIEALKSIGGQAVKSATHDVLGGVGHDFIQDLTGGRSYSETNNPSNELPLSPEEQINREVERLARHREINETRVFDRKAEEAKAKIQAIQEELKFLAQELAGMDIGLKKAIEEEVVNPGTYHVSFLEKLRRFLIDIRKRVADSANWLEMSAQRKMAQKGFWGNVQKSGTKFMLSQERTVATQSG